MQVTYASTATPGQANEDYVVGGPDWALVLDGATKRAEVDSGCVHGPGWLVRTLAGQLAGRLAAELGEPLPDLLAEAIKATCDTHGASCDLGNPDSPSATVVMLRRHKDKLDWLVLADSSLVLDVDGEIWAVVDDRTARLPSYTTEAVRAARNSPDGFWVASTRPEAAYQAVTGSITADQVRRAGLFSDGATRLVERYGQLDWPGLLDLLDSHGQQAVIQHTRAAEQAETGAERAGRRGKRHDDATAVLVRFGS
jgi:hypothetical protein